jgi:hypothetical protein
MQQQGKHTSITIQELLGNDIFCWEQPKRYLRQLKGGLWRSLEAAVNDDGEEQI